MEVGGYTAPMGSNRSKRRRLVALGGAVSLAYIALALHGHVPGGWRLRTLICSPAELAEKARRAHRAERLAAFASERVEAGGVLFIGSSTIEFFDLEAAFPGANAINRGIGDEDLAGLTARLADTLESTACSAVVLYAGSVDFRRHESRPEEVAQGVERLLRAVTEYDPEAHVLLMGILPERTMSPTMGRRLTATNAALEALAAPRPLVSFVNTSRPPVVSPTSWRLQRHMSRDSLHLNEGGYINAASWLLDADEVVARRLRR